MKKLLSMIFVFAAMAASAYNVVYYKAGADKCGFNCSLDSDGLSINRVWSLEGVGICYIPPSLHIDELKETPQKTHFARVCGSRRRLRSWQHFQQPGDPLRVAGGEGSDATAKAVEMKFITMHHGQRP